MKNYIMTAHDPETFKKREIETNIPEVIVEHFKGTFHRLDRIPGYDRTPMMIDGSNDIIVGLIEDGTTRKTGDVAKKYKITISEL